MTYKEVWDDIMAFIERRREEGPTPLDMGNQEEEAYSYNGLGYQTRGSSCFCCVKGEEYWYQPEDHPNCEASWWVRTLGERDMVSLLELARALGGERQGEGNPQREGTWSRQNTVHSPVLPLRGDGPFAKLVPQGRVGA